MKLKLLQMFFLLSVLLLSTNASAHGDHSVMTPEHGLEHAVWFGIGIVAVLLVLNLGKKLLKHRDK